MFSVTSRLAKRHTVGEYDTLAGAEKVAVSGSLVSIRIDDSVWAVIHDDTEECVALAWEGGLYRRITYTEDCVTVAPRSRCICCGGDAGWKEFCPCCADAKEGAKTESRTLGETGFWDVLVRREKALRDHLVSCHEGTKEREATMQIIDEHNLARY